MYNILIICFLYLLIWNRFSGIIKTFTLVIINTLILVFDGEQFQGNYRCSMEGYNKE